MIYLNIQPIFVLIHHLTDKIFAHCPSHLNPLFQQIGNYTLADLANLYEGLLISPEPDQEGNELQRTNSGFIQHTPHEAKYTS
jgi:hypothetical protein